MRIAPLAFFLDPAQHSDRQIIRDVSRITHRHEEAYMGALAMLCSVRHAYERGVLDSELISCLLETLPDSVTRDRILSFSGGDFQPEAPFPPWRRSGYVADSVPLAILIALRARDFLQIPEWSVQLGGDTDTVASMAGQIFGAAYGTSSLPLDLAANLDLFD